MFFLVIRYCPILYFIMFIKVCMEKYYLTVLAHIMKLLYVG